VWDHEVVSCDENHFIVQQFLHVTGLTTLARRWLGTLVSELSTTVTRQGVYQRRGKNVSGRKVWQIEKSRDAFYAYCVTKNLA